MRRGARRSARLLAAAMTAALAASHSMAEEEAYPVWWSPALELESLGDIDERLARRTLDFTVYKGKGGSGRARMSTTATRSSIGRRRATKRA